MTDKMISVLKVPLRRVGWPFKQVYIIWWYTILNYGLQYLKLSLLTMQRIQIKFDRISKMAETFLTFLRYTESKLQ